MTLALVTGSQGFVGSHLQVVLQRAGWRVLGLGRRPALSATEGDYIQADVTDADRLTEIVASVRPDVIFHLAAAVPQKQPDPGNIVHSVVSATMTVCQALRRSRLKCRLVIAGSSAQYGASSRTHEPLDEDAPCRPISAYGHAKLAAESVGLALSADGSFELLAARAFNHIGPGESAATVAGALAARVAAVLEGHAERVEASNMDVVRDFTDVRDIARGYLSLAEHGTPGRTYNLCSGRATAVSDVLGGLLAAAQLDWSVVSIAQGDTTTIPRQVGSARRAQTETGWAARIALERSVRDLLASARRSPSVGQTGS